MAFNFLGALKLYPPPATRDWDKTQAIKILIELSSKSYIAPSILLSWLALFANRYL